MILCLTLLHYKFNIYEERGFCNNKFKIKRIIKSNTKKEEKPKNFKIKIVELIGTAWVQVTDLTLNFGIICQKKGVAYGSLLPVKY